MSPASKRALARYGPPAVLGVIVLCLALALETGWPIYGWIVGSCIGLWTGRR